MGCHYRHACDFAVVNVLVRIPRPPVVAGGDQNDDPEQFKLGEADINKVNMMMAQRKRE